VCQCKSPITDSRGAACQEQEEFAEEEEEEEDVLVRVNGKEMSIHDIAEKEEAEMSKEEYADYVQKRAEFE
jgi:hypothetical protein